MKRMLSQKYLFFFLPLLLFSSCSKKSSQHISKDPEAMNFDELKTASRAFLDKNNKRAAVLYLERLVTQHSDNQFIGEYKLMLADLYFKMSRYIESFEMYNHFRDLYPSDTQAEYAGYRAILSKYYQTLHRDCDSSATEATMALCDKHLQTASHDHYRKDIEDIHRTCERKLIDKEVYIYNCYLRRGKMQSAKNRLKHLKETYLEHDDDLKPRLLYLEGKLAQKEKDKDEVFKKVSELVEIYPDTKYTKMARGLVAKDLFVF